MVTNYEIFLDRDDKYGLKLNNTRHDFQKQSPGGVKVFLKLSQT